MNEHKNESLPEETQKLLNLENKEEEKSNEVINNNEILIKTFLQIFESSISDDSKILDKFNIILTPNTKKYFLILCKDSPDLFGCLEENLNKISNDNKINTKDIPEILVLVSKVYKAIKELNETQIVDPYQIIKSFLHVSFAIYLDNNKIDNPQILIDLLKIVDSSIDLIKLTPLFPKKINCFQSLFSKH